MNVPHESDSEQTRLWNGPSAHAWVEVQDVLDQMYKPIEDLLVDVVSDPSRHRVLDVGCGTGSTTLEAARRLGKGGRSIGIDISQPMITVARKRAEREHLEARFICANAQGYPFEPESVDAIMSRFGVMFFDEPVDAFANLRRAAAPHAELRAIVWRSAAENPFMTTAERAAAPLLSNLPPRRPNVPGQFAFADDRRVRAILEESGWARIDIRPIDVDCTFAERDLVRYVTRLGPVGLALGDVDEATRARVIPTVRTAFDPFVHGSEVRFTAACWMVGARS